MRQARSLRPHHAALQCGENRRARHVLERRRPRRPDGVERSMIRGAVRLKKTGKRQAFAATCLTPTFWPERATERLIF